MAMRALLELFRTANPVYVNAEVTFYTIDANGAKTTTKATLYAGESGTTTVANPQRLDSEGKLRNAVYFEVPVIGTITGPEVSGHDTPVAYIPRARGSWVTSTIYYTGDIIQSPNSGTLYQAQYTHTSGASVAADLAAGKLAIYIDVSAFSTQARAFTFSGTGALSNFTLPVTPVSAENVIVEVASGTTEQLLRPVTDYTVSGTTLTFATPPASGTNNIRGFVIQTGAAASSFVRSGTGGITRTGQSKWEDIGHSAKDYGAIGDSVADDTAALQNLANACSGGKFMVLTEGTYRITDRLDVPYGCAGIFVIGNVVIEADFSTAKRAMDWGDSTHDAARPQIGIGPGKLTIQRKTAPTWNDGASIALRIYNGKFGVVGPILFYRWEEGVELYTNAAGLAGGSTGGSFGMTFDRTEFFTCRIGLTANSQSSGNSGINTVTMIAPRWAGINPSDTQHPVIGIRTKRAASGDKNANQWVIINPTFELGGSRWQRSTAYSLNAKVTAEVTTTFPRKLRLYNCTSGGTSASSGSGPSGTGSGIADGTATWEYVADIDRIPFLFEAGATDWRMYGGRSEGNGPILARFAETDAAGPVTRHVFEVSYSYLDNDLILDTPPLDGTYLWSEAHNSRIILSRRGVSDAPLRRVAGRRDLREGVDYGSDGMAVEGLVWLVGETAGKRLGRQMRRVTFRREAARLGQHGPNPFTSTTKALGALFDVSAGGQLVVDPTIVGGTSRRLIVALFDANGELISTTHGAAITKFRARLGGGAGGAFTFYDTTAGYLGAYRQNTDGVGLDVLEFGPVASTTVAYAFVGVATTAEIAGLEFYVPVSERGIVPIKGHYGAGENHIRAAGQPTLAAAQTIDEGAIILADRPDSAGTAGWIVRQGGTMNTSGSTAIGSPAPAAYRIQNRNAIVFDSANSGGYGNLTVGEYITVSSDTGCRVEAIYPLSAVPAWLTARYVRENDFCTNAGELYIAEGAGVTGATVPTHTGGSAFSDGTVTWRHVDNIASPSGGTGPLHSVAHVHKAITSATGRSTITYTTTPLFGILPVQLEGELVHDPGSIGAGAGSAPVDVTVTGARVGDIAEASFSLDPQTIRMFSAVTANDTVSVILFNFGGSPVDLASGTIRARVTKQ